MNIKTKRILLRLALALAVFVFLLFYLDKWIILFFPKTEFYVDILEHFFIYFFLGTAVYGVALLYNRYLRKKTENYIFTNKPEAVSIAQSKTGKAIYLSPEERNQHIHVIGTTGVGKTEFVLNMMVQDIEQGRGFILIEHKSDHTLLNQIYAKIKETGREKDFHLFSLVHPEKSSLYNPLIGEDPQILVERVFNAFNITHEFYRKVQYQWLSQIICLLIEVGEKVTFEKLSRIITDEKVLKDYLKKHEKNGRTLLGDLIHKFLQEPKSFRIETLKGLEVHLSSFCTGKTGALLNTEAPEINFDDALSKNKIIYFQLPTLKFYELSVSLGKLVLQDFQSAVSERQTKGLPSRFYSCYLDEFSSLAYSSFTELISKARSANIGLVLSHQAIGDLTKVSDDFSNAVLTNTNTKVVFRCPDPDTAEYFGKAFGTETIRYVTEQTESKVVGDPRTGLGSIREVEKFIVHPEEIKKFPRATGVVSVATPFGIKIEKCHFNRAPELKLHPIPIKHTLTKEIIRENTINQKTFEPRKNIYTA